MVCWEWAACGRSAAAAGGGGGVPGPPTSAAPGATSKEGVRARSDSPHAFSRQSCLLSKNLFFLELPWPESLPCPPGPDPPPSRDPSLLPADRDRCPVSERLARMAVDVTGTVRVEPDCSRWPAPAAVASWSSWLWLMLRPLIPLEPLDDSKRL